MGLARKSVAPAWYDWLIEATSSRPVTIMMGKCAPPGRERMALQAS